MIYADDLLRTRKNLRGGYWVVAKPEIPWFSRRLYEAWQIITGRAMAVIFYEDEKDDKGSCSTCNGCPGHGDHSFTVRCKSWTKRILKIDTEKSDRSEQEQESETGL